MDLVNKLRKHQQNKRSIRKALLAYGNKNWTNYARPLSQLDEEEIVTLILNWIPKALKPNEEVMVRLRADSKVYEVRFKKARGTIYVKQLKEKKQKMEHMYSWKPNETFNDITLEKLRQSIALASVLSQLN